MRRAVARLPSPPDLALVDGNQPPSVACPVQCVVGGDALSLSIAAASIIAKVLRDRAMGRLAVRFPGYGWEDNAGYSTPAIGRRCACWGRPSITGRISARSRQLTGPCATPPGSPNWRIDAASDGPSR